MKVIYFACVECCHVLRMLSSSLAEHASVCISYFCLTSVHLCACVCTSVRHGASQASPWQGSAGASEGVWRNPAAVWQAEAARGAVGSACAASEASAQVLPPWPTVTRGRLEVPDGHCYARETTQAQVLHVLPTEEDCQRQFSSILLTLLYWLVLLHYCKTLIIRAHVIFAKFANSLKSRN